MAAEREQQPVQLMGLQAARAAAAVLVLLFHTSGSIFGLTKYGGVKPFGNVFDFGNAGVNFFFVLSGFIIFYAHGKDIGQPRRLGAYFWKRFSRIYPIYWIVLLIVLPVYFIVPTFGTGNETNPWVILSSFLLVHIKTEKTVLIVSWTLFQEILFYFIFALLIVNRRFGLFILTIWLAASLAPLITPLIFGPLPEGTSFYFDPLHLLFGMGMAAALWASGRKIQAPGFLLACGVAAFLGTGMERAYFQTLSWGVEDLLFGLASTAILLGLVGLERMHRLRIPDWVALTGEASYVIYLTHFMILSLAAKIILPSLRRLHSPDGLSFFILAALALIAGIVFHKRVEKPLLLLTRRQFFRRPVSPPTPEPQATNLDRNLGPSLAPEPGQSLGTVRQPTAGVSRDG